MYTIGQMWITMYYFQYMDIDSHQSCALINSVIVKIFIAQFFLTVLTKQTF